LRNSGLKKCEITNKESKRVYEVEWHENGQKRSEVNCKDGKRHGLTTYWHEDGQKSSERNYKDGKLNGLWTSWLENGQKESEINYKKGQERSARNYKNGKLHGLSTDWLENGQKRSEQNWKDGKLYGLWTEWHENGRKSMELTEKEGELDGLWTEWYENGQKKWEINRKEKKLISTESWKPNGEKCPVTNVKDGNGVVVLYKEDGAEKIHLNEDQLDQLCCSQDRQASLCKEFSVQNNTQSEGKIGSILIQKLELLKAILHKIFRKLKRVGTAGIVIGYVLISYCAIYAGHPIFAIIGCFVLLASYICFYWD
jgi:antitoxin component YwqK of YwqJK toxin-antitoxin module